MACAKMTCAIFGGYCGEMYAGADVKHEIHSNGLIEKAERMNEQ